MGSTVLVAGSFCQDLTFRCEQFPAAGETSVGIFTSTGFGSAGAQMADVERWASTRRGSIQIKASGGVKTLADAAQFPAAGCTRLGTSSARAILDEFLTGRAAAATSGY